MFFNDVFGIFHWAFGSIKPPKPNHIKRKVFYLNYCLSVKWFTVKGEEKNTFRFDVEWKEDVDETLVSYQVLQRMGCQLSW